jgi:hypothetical protein
LHTEDINMGWYIYTKELGPGKCTICEEPVKAGDKVYFETLPSRPMHAVCVWERAEAEKPKAA